MREGGRRSSFAERARRAVGWIRGRGKPLVVTVVAIAVGVGGSLLAYRKLVEKGYVRYNKWDRRVRGTLRVGDQAPDVALTTYAGAPLRLSSLWSKRPVVLVFGSCT